MPWPAWQGSVCLRTCTEVVVPLGAAASARTWRAGAAAGPLLRREILRAARDPEDRSVASGAEEPASEVPAWRKLQARRAMAAEAQVYQAEGRDRRRGFRRRRSLPSGT